VAAVNPVERQERLRRLQRRAAITGAIGIAIAIVGLITGSRGLFAVGAAFAVVLGVLMLFAWRGASNARSQ
jgi:hypothetical protein